MSMNCTTVRTTLPPPTIDRRLRSRISTPRQSSSCNSTNELRFYANSLLLQHSIRLSHARSDCSGSMHLLLNQWTVTIRFHICHRLEGFSAKKIFFLLHRQTQESERAEKRKFNWFFLQCLSRGKSRLTRLDRSPSQVASYRCRLSEKSATIWESRKPFGASAADLIVSWRNAIPLCVALIITRMASFQLIIGSSSSQVRGWIVLITFEWWCVGVRGSSCTSPIFLWKGVVRGLRCVAAVSPTVDSETTFSLCRRLMKQLQSPWSFPLIARIL